MSFRAEPLPGHHKFGAVIRHLTPAALDDPETRRALNDLWIDKGLLVFRGTDGERATHVKLSHVFGDFEIHPVPTGRLPEFPELIRLHYKPSNGTVVVIDNEERGSYLPWHSDLIYVDRINRAGSCVPLRFPREV